MVDSNTTLASGIESDSYEEHVPENIPRRRVLQGAAAMSGVLLAGCGGTETTEDGSGNGEMPQLHVYLPGGIGSRSQIHNPWGREANYHKLAWMVHPHVGRYSTTAEFNGSEEETFEHQEYIPLGTKSLNIDQENGRFEISLYDDWQWTSGDEVTAQDVMLYPKIHSLIHSTSVIWGNLSDIRSDGDKKVIVETSGVNPQFAASRIFSTGWVISTPYEINGEKTIFVDYLERLQDANTREEINSISEELSREENFPIPETPTCGPWNITDNTSTEVMVDPNPGYHSEVNYEALIQNFDPSGGRAKPRTAFFSGKSVTGPIPKSSQGERVRGNENQEYVIRQGTAVQGLALNWNTEPETVPEIYTNPKFRQAIAYILDNEKIARATPTWTSPTERADGCFWNASEDLLPNIYGDLRSYDVDRDKATQMLQDLGLTKQDGTWHYNGEPMSISHISPAYHHWPASGRATMAQLDQFGFQTSFEIDERFGSILWSQSDNTWDSLRTHTGAKTSLAYFDVMFGPDSMVYFPETIEVPMPVGNWDGELTEVNTYDLVSGIAKLTGDEYTQRIEKLAWIYNYALPSIPTNTENWGMMFKTDNWEWPDRDDPMWAVNFINRSLMSVPAAKPK